jgi:hypothetical protein
MTNYFLSVFILKKLNLYNLTLVEGSKRPYFLIRNKSEISWSYFLLPFDISADRADEDKGCKYDPLHEELGYTVFTSHARAVAQGNVVRAMSASYRKSLYSTLRRNQTP